MLWFSQRILSYHEGWGQIVSGKGDPKEGCSLWVGTPSKMATWEQLWTVWWFHSMIQCATLESFAQTFERTGIRHSLLPCFHLVCPRDRCLQICEHLGCGGCLGSMKYLKGVVWGVSPQHQEHGHSKALTHSLPEGNWATPGNRSALTGKWKTEHNLLQMWKFRLLPSSHPSLMGACVFVLGIPP